MKTRTQSKVMSGICPPFWLDSPQVLWTNARDFFPFTATGLSCTATALNAFTRFGIYLGILFAIIRMETSWLLLGVAFAGFAAAAWIYMMQNGTVREGFGGDKIREYHDPEDDVVQTTPLANKYLSDVIGAGGPRTVPDAPNPFMNVLLTEIADNPYREPAANVQSTKVRNDLDNYFQTMFASDAADVYQRNQNQRQWVSMPVTTIPNDQKAFQDWLFLTPGQSCKEGNQAACTFYETGAQKLPWRSL